ncbi:MAG: DNA recombination protein RmuC [Sphingobacteriaceae bacterium]
MIIELTGLALTVLALIAAYIRCSKKLNSVLTEKTEQGLRLAKAEERSENLLLEKENITALLQQEQARLIAELQQERHRSLELSQSLERIKTFYKTQQEKIAEQKAEIETLQVKFNKEFELIAGKILDDKTLRFTEVNKSNLDQLIAPLKENIKAFEDKIEKVYKAESDERNVLKGELGKLIELNRQISQEAHNLTKALKADTKKQGNWGEFVLDRILEMSGLIKGESFTKQTNFTDENGNRLQPDVVITLPDNKHIIIDSKVSLIAYERLINCEAEEERITHLNDHILSFKNHIKGLSNKNYSDIYRVNSPDFVLLFVPVESSFAIAVQHDVELFEFAWSKRVVIVTPSTLLATLKTIASIWKQEQQTRNAIDIATKAGALYDKFVGFINDLKKVGDNLDKAKESYADAFGKLSSGNGNLIGRVENLRKLGAKTNKQIEDKFLVEE